MTKTEWCDLWKIPEEERDEAWAAKLAMDSRLDRRLHAVQGDIPAFISPIDGTVVEGRAAYREHCKRHDVVPTEELKGLPPKPFNQQYKGNPEEVRRTIAQVIDSRADIRRQLNIR